MSNYLPSNKVKIYPSGFRGTDNKTNLLDPESRLVSEKNLTSGIKALTNNSTKNYNSKNSFVISNEPISLSNFEICIYGYIFNLDLTEFITNGAGKDWTNIWAKIKLSNLEVSGLGDAENKVTVQTLVGNKVEGTQNSNVLDVQESTGSSTYMFTGLDLNSEGFDLAPDEYQLHILIRNSISDDWRIPKASKLLISTDRIGFADTAKPISDMLTYDTIKGLTVIGINEIEPSGDNSTIGAGKQFKSANIGTIIAETISASSNITAAQGEISASSATIPLINVDTISARESGANVTIRNIETSKIENIGFDSTIGTESKYFPTGYIDNIYANKINTPTVEDVTDITSPESKTSALNITGVSRIIPKDISDGTGTSVSSGLGNSGNRFSYGYFKNLTTEKLTVDSEFQRLRSNTKLDPGTYELYLTRDMSGRTDYYSFSLLEIIDKTNNGWIAYAHANVAIPIPIGPAVVKTCFYSFQLKCTPSSNNLEVFKLVSEDSGMNISLDNDTGVKIPGAESMAPITYKVFYRKIF